MDGINFTNIYKQYYNRVYRISLSIIKDPGFAEDIVQETFIKAWRKVDSIQEEEKIGSWLSVIAKRTAIDMLRQVENKHPALLDEEYLMNIGDNSNGHVEKEVEILFLTKEINQCIRSLQPIYRDVLLLKINYELKGVEIARRLNLAVPTVKTRMLRARRQLQEMITNIA
ncbi:RNA polymerase sigma factor [Ornithinibacillus halotolerans]|uniref:RNA polymerase sigma factor n=1 Tax=Ornithinibacillus halotolerans TaxID=1274357 RepID=A0A916W904_9BACI|nr:RNA polymerase sigma factor [Ornithinibacillus halotolerans]GGA77167.1 hypothetical protein GCM10008025_20990 [Ornithinibacillus halotolerans]